MVNQNSHSVRIADVELNSGNCFELQSGLIQDGNRLLKLLKSAETKCT